MPSSSDLSTILMTENDNNPYVGLLWGALADHRVSVVQPEQSLVLRLTRAALNNPDCDILQLEWLHGFYLANDYTDQKILDWLITIGATVILLCDLLIVSQLQTAVVWTVHNKRHHEGRYPRTERLVKEFAFLVADAVTVKCDRAREEIASMYQNVNAREIYIVPDGNYISYYENDVSRREARSEFSVGSDTFVYLFLGMIREYKGIPELINAFDDIERSDTELWIVGRPQTDHLEREISDLADGNRRVKTVFEYIEDERVQYYMKMADALVLPYRDILNSGSVHLGLSFGVPIVAPRIGCIPATVPPENEFLYDREEPGSLERELKRIYNHPDLESIGRANLERARAQSWDRTAERLMDVYRKTMA